MRWPLLALPFVTVATLLAQGTLADRLAQSIAARLQPLAAFAVSGVGRESSPALAAGEAARAAGELTAGGSSEPLGETRSRHAPSARRDTAPQRRSLFVSAATVLRLVESSARPRGTPVAAKAQRPAGLRLSGVSALGIGVQEGDVLTEAAGVPALDASSVVQAILAARARGAPSISGTLFRRDEPWAIVVEQPYLESPRAKP